MSREHISYWIKQRGAWRLRMVRFSAFRSTQDQIRKIRKIKFKCPTAK